MAKLITNWSKRRNATLRKAVKNFNAKVERQLKKGVSPDILPGKMKVSELKEMINTEGDYRKILNSLRSWTKRGAEKVVETKGGAVVTQWALKEAKKHKGEINKRREKINQEFVERPIYVDGEELTNVERTVEEMETKPLTKDVEKLNQMDFKSFSEWLWRERLDERDINKGIWFIQDISEVFYSEFSALNANYLIRLLQLVGGDVAYNLYHSGVDELNPKWQYSEPIEEQEKVEKLEKILIQYLTPEQLEQLATEFERAKPLIKQDKPNQRINNKRWEGMKRNS